MSNPNDRNRNLNLNLKPNVSNQSQYSASPSQLTLSSDIPSHALPNPYQTQNPYAYIASPHDPTAGFVYPPQPAYRPQLQTQHHQQQQQQQQQQQPHPSQLQQPSPTTSRKRRASELGEPSLPGSSSSNASAFTNPSGMMSGGMSAGGMSTGSDYGLGDATGVGGGPSQQQTMPSPVVAKKGRTNTPWTPAEEQRLKTLRDAGSSWSEIAKTFPTRTEGSVKKHWYKDMHYAEFAEDEVSNFSAALLQAIKDYENNKWKVIGQKVGKPAKACEQFAKEQGWKV